MNEQLFFSDNRASGAFLPLVLFGFSLAVTLGFQTMDQVDQRARLKNAIIQQAPVAEQTRKMETRLHALLSSFNEAAPEEARAVFQKINLRVAPAAPASSPTPAP